MEYNKGRYSWVIRPILVVFDLLCLNLFAIYFFDFNQEEMYFFSIEIFNNRHFLYVIYSIILWFVSSNVLAFYKVYRYTSALNILSLLSKQFIVYSIIFFAFIGAFRSIDSPIFNSLVYLLTVFFAIALAKYISYYALKYFRKLYKGNLRYIVIIGNSASAEEMHKLAILKKELGYKIKASFTDKKFINVNGKPEDCFSYLAKEKGFDEVYCSIEAFNETDINRLVKLAEINHFNLKFLQDEKVEVTKRLKKDFYNYLPVLSLQEVALNKDLNKVIKRTFDIVFSSFVIVFILSWLTPLLYIFIKLESKGPLFYKHTRNGINYKEFKCYKFRSLRINEEIKGSYIKKEDDRVTKVGQFLRRTNLDEMPQFFNVLLGDMSIVGPRPHMLSYTEDYSKQIDKYDFIFRHNVKPGITGLAQVKGYRGEIKSKEDIINRIKYDNFYIENWNLLLDINIIIATLVNMIKGQKEAY